MVIIAHQSLAEVWETGPVVSLLLAELPLPRKTTVVDIGANPIHPPPYADLLKVGGCRVVGFEPQAEAFAKLQATRTADETYFPFAVGDGASCELRVYKSSGMTSIFDLYARAIQALGMRVTPLVDKIKFESIALDRAEGVPPFDLLKIDIQGGENRVFRGAEQALKAAVAVIVELRYMRLYRGEPMLGGVDTELRRQGFYLHKFMFNKSMPLRNSQAKRLKARLVSDQLVDGDGIYIRNIAEPDKMGAAQLMHLAILGAAVFMSHSLVLYCLDELVRRGVVRRDLPEAYVSLLPARLVNQDQPVVG